MRRFPDGETHLRVISDVQGKPAQIVCTLAHPDGEIMPLILAAGALREWEATRVDLIAPCLAYLRQDTHFNRGEALSARHFARLLSAHVDSLLTIDPHLHRIKDLGEIYSIPTRVVSAAPLLGAWIAAEVAQPFLVGPDSESRQWVAAAAAAANADYAVLTKSRRGDRCVELAWPDLHRFAERTPARIDLILVKTSLRA